MGTVYASAIFTDVDTVLLDDGKDRWPDVEKLRYLNAGQRQAVIFKPDVYTLGEVYRLVAGTRQSVPDGTSSFQTPAGATIKECLQLIKVVRNITVLSSLLTAWANVNYDTFTSSGRNITSAITAAGGDSATSGPIVITSGNSYRLVCVPTLTSGALPEISGTAGFPTTALAAGTNTIDFTATAASITLTVSNAGAGNWSCTFFLFDRTTYPSATIEYLVGGSVILPVGMDMLDAYNPDWHSATPAATVKNYVFNDDDPGHFYVTPPQPNSGMGYIEAIFSAAPADVSANAGPPVDYDVAISISDVFRDTLKYFILFSCYSKDAALSPYNAQRAVEFWNLFVLSLERKDLVKRATGPNVKKENPSTEP